MDSPFGDLADFSLLDVLMLARLAALLEYRAVKWIEDMGIEQPFPDLIFLHESLPKSTSNENDVLATYFSAVVRNCTAQAPHQSATIEQCIVRDCETASEQCVSESRCSTASERADREEGMAAALLAMMESAASTGCSIRWTPGCVKMRLKVVFPYLQKENETQLFHPISHNLGPTF